MKIRTDFVTNSSSSAFVIVTTKANFDKVYETLSPYVKAVAAKMFNKTEVFGKECLIAETFDSNGYTWTEDFYVEVEPDDDDADCPWEAFNKIQTALEEDKSAVFSYSVDM